jgi:hypothetical protein
LPARQKSRKGGTENMKVLKQVMTVLGTALVIAVLAAIVMPKTARPMVATLAQVAHTLANPAPTVWADEPTVFEGGAPFNCEFSTTDACTVTLYTVPAHKVAVIESVSGVCFNLSPPSTIREFQMHLTGPNGEAVQLSFPSSPPNNSFGGIGNVTEVALNFRAYAFGGTSGAPITMEAYSTTYPASAYPYPAYCSLEVIGRLSEDSHSNEK